MRKTASPWGKLLLVSGLVLTSHLAVQAHAGDEDRGPKVTETYDYTGFDEIDISGVFDVEVKVGESYSIQLEGRAKDMERARVELDGDTLELGRKKGGWKNKNSKTIRAYVTLPSLNGLDVSGVTDVNVENIKAGAFSLDVSGVADVTLAGKCDTLDADLSGVSDVDAEEFKCQSAVVDMSGVGDMELYASDAIDADVSGVGDVVVYGKPEKVKKSVSKYTASLTVK